MIAYRLIVIVLCSSLLISIFTHAPGRQTNPGQTTGKITEDEPPEAVKQNKKDAILGAKAKKEEETIVIGINVDLAKEAKITYDDKQISYAKFMVLVELAPHSFVIEEGIIKNGKFTTITLVKSK
jgi:hypothetical protein